MGDGEQRTGSSIGRVLAVQAVAYVVLFGVTGVLEFTFGNQGGVAQGVAIALAVVLLVLFQVGWPFRAGIADRLIGAVAGVLSILCARTSLASQLFYPAYEGGRLADDGRLVMYQLVRWAACFAILLIAATIIAFGRQMVRAERSHLIRALSHCMTGAVVSVSAAGWCFVPDLIDMGSASPDNGLLTRFIIVAAAFVVVAARGGSGSGRSGAVAGYRAAAGDAQRSARVRRVIRHAADLLIFDGFLRRGILVFASMRCGESVPVIQPTRFFLSGGGVRRRRVAIMSGLIETVATDRPPATGSHGGAWVEDLGCAQ